MTPSSVYPEQENSQDHTLNTTEDFSSLNQEAPLACDTQVEENQIENVRNSIVPVLTLNTKDSNITLIWSLVNELTKEILSKDHKIFNEIKGYEIFGFKRIKIKQEMDVDDETIDPTKWLSLGMIKSKTTPSQVVLKDFQNGNYYYFTIRVRYNDDTLGEYSKTERISFD